MNEVDTILSDGRKLSRSEIDVLEDRIDSNLYQVDKEEFYRCAYSEDPDFKYISNRECEGVIAIDTSKLICGECGRMITDPHGKAIFEEYELNINKREIRDKLRKAIKKEFNVKVNAIERTYFGRKFNYVLNISDLNVNVFLVFSNIRQEILEHCKIYNENPVFSLVGDSILMANNLSKLQIPHFKFTDAYPNTSERLINSINEGRKKQLANRELCADLSYRHCSNDATLTRMKYDDFERCVQNLLAGSIMTSTLLGSSEAGSGVPDGLLTLPHNNSPLFMWDAKFVDYKLGNRTKTTLKSEYDKIFRHETSIEAVPSISEKFNGVEGIILFTPGIKESNVKRLAEFMKENNFMHNNVWKSSICYFKFEALLELFNLYNQNKSNVKNKEKGFRAVLHKFVTSSSKHESDPDIISNTENCLEISVEDIHEIFSKVETLGVEEEEVPHEEYLSYLDLMSE